MVPSGRKSSFCNISTIPTWKNLRNLISFLLTLTYLRASLGRHLQSGVVSENGLIASKNAIDDAFHLVRDEYHKNRTKVKFVELY